MENLTRSLRVVFNVPDCNPVPDHDIVVFNKLGVAGLEFRELVPAGSRFKKRFFERGEFEAFAVSRDENRHYAFSQAGTHMDQKHTYILHLSIHYKVANSRRIVEKLELDPLKQLKEEALKVLGGTARQIDWQILAEEKSELERRLLEFKSVSEQDIEISNLERLRQVAQDLGLSIKQISIHRTLTKEGKILRTDHEETLDHELAKRRKARAQDLQGDEFDAAIRQTILARITGVKDPISASETQQIIASLRSVGASARELISPKSSDADHVPGVRLLAAAPGDGLLGDLTAQVSELRTLLDNDSPAERQLGSSLLHLIAELSLGSDAEDDILQRYAEKLSGSLRDREIYRRLRLDSRQIKLVDRLREPLQLKEEISREEKR